VSFSTRHLRRVSAPARRYLRLEKVDETKSAIPQNLLVQRLICKRYEEATTLLNYAYPEIHPNVRTSRLRADLVRPVPLYKNSALAKNVKKVVLQINPVDASFRNFVPTKTGVKATQESKLQDRISVSRVQKFSHVVFTDPIFTTDPRSFRHHETRQNAFRQVLLRDQILNETPTGILGFTFFF
jgi:hypothetical protein